MEFYYSNESEWDGNQTCGADPFVVYIVVESYLKLT